MEQTSLNWLYLIAAVASIATLVAYPVYSFLRLMRQHEQLQRDIRETRQAIADPTHGTGSYITRATILAALKEHDVHAAAIMEKKLQQIREDQEKFISQSLIYRKETLDSIREIFARLAAMVLTIEGVLGKFMDLVAGLARKEQSNGKRHG